MLPAIDLRRQRVTGPVLRDTKCEYREQFNRGQRHQAGDHEPPRDRALSVTPRLRAQAFRETLADLNVVRPCAQLISVSHGAGSLKLLSKSAPVEPLFSFGIVRIGVLRANDMLRRLQNFVERGRFDAVPSC